MKNLIAVIAARGGSRRVKNKNIRKFGKNSLLERKIIQLKKIREIDEIVVNSDSDKILKIAEKYKVTTVKRRKKYASNTISINKVYVNVVEDLDTKNILFIHITSPFVKTDTIKKSIRIYNKLNYKYDSLASVTQFKKFLWHKNKPINYIPEKMPRSQDLPNYYYLNFAINILPKQVLLKQRNIIGKKIYPYELSELESFDIDTIEEFEIAKKLII